MNVASILQGEENGVFLNKTWSIVGKWEAFLHRHAYVPLRSLGWMLVLELSISTVLLNGPSYL